MTARTDQTLSKGELTDKIALKVSSMLTDSSIFKTAISKLQSKPTAQQGDLKNLSSQLPRQVNNRANVSSDEHPVHNVEKNSGNQNASVRYLYL